MKITLTFKSPDAVHDALLDISDRDERDDLYSEIAGWVRYGEYLDVEYDTDTKEMTVLRK